MGNGQQTITMVRGNSELKTNEALDLLRLLIPVLEAAPDNEEAQSAAHSVISRMPRNEPAAAMLDWWFVTTTGGQTPLGWAYNLPDTIDEALRSAMTEVMLLGHAKLGVPIAQWLRESRMLPERLPTIEKLINLDSYGKSKLPGERDVWAWFLSELHQTVNALREGRPATEFTIDHRLLERELGRAAIEPNSRRWKEIVKRVEECTIGINDLVNLQAIAAPWLGLFLPQPLDAVPTQATAELGDLAPAVFAALIEAGERSWLTQMQYVAEQAESISKDLTEADLAWWSTVISGWLLAANDQGLRVQLPLIQQAIARRTSIQREIDELRNSGIETDDAELHLLDHDLSAASQAIKMLKDKRQLDRRADALENKLAQLRLSSEEDLPVPANWVARIAAAETVLSGGEIEMAKSLVDELEFDLRRARRADEIAELHQLRSELTGLAAPAVVFADLDAHLAELAAHEDSQVNREIQQRLADRLVALRSQRGAEVAELLGQIHALLDGAGKSLPDAEQNEFDLKLPEIEQAEIAGDMMLARRLALDLLSSIQEKRVYRWDRNEGESKLVEHVLTFCTQELDFDEDDIRRLYVAAKTKPFVILAGLTGSGKSTIARLLAAALGANSGNGRFRRVAVRPDWIDQSDVLGVVNPMSNRFEPGWLAVIARQCEQNLDQIHVVLLDEMNLAPVEQYLAEYLSALEEARSGHDATRLPLYSDGAEPVNRHDWPSSLPFPRNLIVIGTVNVDETTRVLSERVLDRANVLQLSVAMSEAHHGGSTIPVRPWHVPFSEWDAICVRQPDPSRHAFLVEIGEILQTIGIGVGARAHVELERFLANAAGILAPEAALDLGVLQRIIPKVRGFKRELVDGLDELQEILEKHSCQRSARIISRWLADSVSEDEFIDGTDARIGLLR